MAKQSQAKHGGGKKIGRSSRHPSHTAYTLGNHRFKNKLKRVLQSSGAKAAEEYTKKYKNAKNVKEGLKVGGG